MIGNKCTHVEFYVLDLGKIAIQIYAIQIYAIQI